MIKVVLYFPVKFKRVPTTLDVIRNTLYYSFFILVIAAGTMFALSFENFLIFPSPSPNFESLLLILLFYLLSDLGEPRLLAYYFIKSVVFILSIPFRLRRKNLREFKIKPLEEVRLPEGELLPFTIALKSVMPFTVIYLLIFVLLRLWENRFGTMIIASFFLATWDVISNTRYIIPNKLSNFY